MTIILGNREVCGNENNDTGNCRINNNKTTSSKPFEYKKKIIGTTPADNSRLDAEVVVPLEYLSNFWRSLDLPLIYCELELNMRWKRNCIISEILRTVVFGGDNPVTATTTASEIFQINNAKLYVFVVTLSINDNIKFSEHLTQEFRGTVLWKKYRSEIRTEPKNNNLDCMFRNINRLFVV